MEIFVSWTKLFWVYTIGGVALFLLILLAVLIFVILPDRQPEP
jgi:hypothetical protein